MDEQGQLSQRWDHFLMRIAERFDALLTEGRETVLASLDENGLDHLSSSRTLQAIIDQVRSGLIARIDDTWREQVEPAMRLTGADAWMDESRKGHDLYEQLQGRLVHWQVIMEGELAKKFLVQAIRGAEAELQCTQCNAAIHMERDLFQAHYVTCPYCNTVNTVLPDTNYLQIGWTVADNIARLEALDAWQELQTVLARTGRYGRPGATAAERTAAHRRYLERFFDERIKILPRTATTREADIQRELNKLDYHD